MLNGSLVLVGQLGRVLGGRQQLRPASSSMTLCDLTLRSLPGHAHKGGRRAKFDQALAGMAAAQEGLLSVDPEICSAESIKRL